ncbi:MAG: Gfo/Idh/MocA family oxidoreductase [Acidimicrobiia bacterium]|nr:Gfo/Idh/MocA family oxidoreductase [Acidimicrobiia bacterium]
MIGVGVIGYGYWGPNLVRNFAWSDAARVVAVADRRDARLGEVRRRFPGVRVTTAPEDLIADPAVDAVAIATPVATHHALALAALRAGKHVLVEKPLASSARECAQLVDEAAARRLTLMVDHTFVYTPAVRRMRELVETGEIGDIYYFDSVRINLGLFQPDVNVLWDLAVHDLSIMDFVLAREPLAVSATGVAHVPGEQENIAYLTMFFADKVIGHVHANWLAPVKVRRTLIGGSRRMIVFDDLEASEKIKVYDRGVSLAPGPESRHQMQVGYRAGDVWSPQLAVTEGLQIAVAHFIECVTAGTTPITDGAAGLRLVRLLETATASMAARGATIELQVPA